MSLPTLLLLEGFLYIVLFGGLSFLRREGLSGQFAIEAATLTVITSGLAALSGFSIHPILFLIIIYLITMRVRLLVDVGNVFARRRQFTYADRIYTIAARLWPDNSNQLIVLINRGTLRLHQGELDEAITTFTGILQKVHHGHLGIKYEAATHYNLGVAYRLKKVEAQAIKEFNAVLDTWPASEYAPRAKAAIEKTRLNK